MSNLGGLSECLVDNDPAARVRARRLRSKALVLSVALDALKLIEDHDYQLRDAAARILRWNGRLLVPLYHPSPQVIITVRTLEEQMDDLVKKMAALPELSGATTSFRSR